MSLKTFLQHLGESITSLFHKLTPEAKKVVDTSVRITEVIKSIIDNPVLDFGVSLTTTLVDNDLLLRARAIIPELLKDLHLCSDCLSETDPEKFAACMLANIGKQNEIVKDTFYRELAAHLAVQLSDGEFTIDEALTTVIWYYRKHVKK